MSHKIVHNNLAAVRKSTLPLKLNKSAYIMIALKINMTTDRNYYSQILIV